MRASITSMFYGRRKGAMLGTTCAQLLNTLLPSYSLDLESFKSPALIKQFLKEKGFKGIILEIGFGYGEHVYSLARSKPDYLIIGAEVYINGVACLLKQLDAEPLNNILIFNDNAKILIDALPEGILEEIYLLFPDPWPKTRHNKRRFANLENIQIFYKLLGSAGIFNFASDHDGYAQWVFDIIKQNARLFTLKSSLDEYLGKPWPSHSQTRYEKKALKVGKLSYYMDLHKIAPAAE